MESRIRMLHILVHSLLQFSLRFIYINLQLPSYSWSSKFNWNATLKKGHHGEKHREHYWQRDKKVESSSNGQAVPHLSGCGNTAVAVVTSDGLRLRLHWMLLRTVESGSEWRRRRTAVHWDWETRVGTAGTGGRGNSVQGHLFPLSRPPRAPRNQPLLPQWAYLSINCTTQTTPLRSYFTHAQCPEIDVKRI